MKGEHARQWTFRERNGVENKGASEERDNVAGATINPLSEDILTTLLPRLTLVGYKIQPGLM